MKSKPIGIGHFSTTRSRSSNSALTSGVEVIQHAVHTLAAGTKETSVNIEAVATSPIGGSTSNRH